MGCISFDGCPACGRETGAPAEVCTACVRVVALRRAVAPLWTALERGDEEATALTVAEALARVGGPAVAADLRDWLLPRVPLAVTPGAVVELLGTLPDAAARAQATRIAIDNFTEKKLAGRWERVVARIPTAEARGALIAALSHEDETVRWTAIHAMLEEWETVPAEAAPALRLLLRSAEESGEVQFCAAALLARMEDPELGRDCAAWLAEAIVEAEGTVANSLTEPTIAAAVLARREESETRETAWRFLLRRLEGGSEAILSRALPALLAHPTRELVDALVAGCQARKPRSPSAVTLARAFRSVREPALRAYAWGRLSALLGDGGPAASESVAITLAQALGHLGCLEARPLLEAVAHRTQEPLLLDAVCEALARLGDPAAIDACASLLLGELEDGVAGDGMPAEGARPARGRAMAMAEVLGDIADAHGRARAVAPLVRALARPTLTRAAASALTALAAWEPTPTAIPVEEPALAAPVPAVAEVSDSIQTGSTGSTGWIEEDQPAPHHPVDPVDPVEEDRSWQPGVLAAVGASLADLEAEIGQFPPAFFRYEGMEGETLAYKERMVLSLLCEELQPALDRLGQEDQGPEWRAWMSRAWHLKARLHHALTCDALARAGSDALRERQRWDQMKLAECAYQQTVKFADEPERQARALFDLGVLLAEAERRETAALTFERALALGLRAPLATAAEQNLAGLRKQDQPELAPEDESGEAADHWNAALLVARKALRGALWSSAGLAACGAIAWCAWTGLPRPASVALAQRPAVIAQVEVTRWQAKVRVRRALGAPKVKTSRRGERLAAIGRDDLWWKVQFANGVTGWIPRRFTREVD